MNPHSDISCSSAASSYMSTSSLRNSSAASVETVRFLQAYESASNYLPPRTFCQSIESIRTWPQAPGHILWSFRCLWLISYELLPAFGHIVGKHGSAPGRKQARHPVHAICVPANQNPIFILQDSTHNGARCFFLGNARRLGKYLQRHRLVVGMCV